MIELQKTKLLEEETKNVFHKLNFKIPDYIPDLLRKYGGNPFAFEDNITEDAEFEIIQPKQLT